MAAAPSPQTSPRLEGALEGAAGRHDIVLHHYPSSPFAEKVRLVLGFKQLAWRSVTIPVMLPKPDVVALTGGYRRTPVMQIGADVYCDSALICRVLDRLAPEPPLWPPEAAGLADIVAQWSDAMLFWVAVPFTMQPAGAVHVVPDRSPEFLNAFRADRAAMTASLRRPPLADMRAQLFAYLERIERMLADGRAYVLGSAPSIADFALAHPIWFMRLAPPIAALLEPYRRLGGWVERILAFGHGAPGDLSSSEAIAIAAAAGAHAPTTVDAGEPFGPGAAVKVSALDYATDEVAGTLVGLTRDEVVIARDDPRAGRVHVHFPRVGFQVKAAPSEENQR
ncbi:glutathione S-transferase family protein [Piscinibacter koreensis]|uniref:Glutathione S-transferase family protein n=1 Tax=Piscinibacter koreensis TaxID=2742824 RepID=A0A7Y6NRZ1_9BURK|nr:glutathione S-transferase family protein [Schlegelella koreensis]NUZ08236.1 glutathione S-transferase family protein [Schlegelella koreensis]